MVFFIWGFSSRRSLTPNPEQVLQGYDACVRCGHRPVGVMDTTRSCHFCFVPLFPVSQSTMVICTACQLPAALPFHLEQSRLRGGPQSPPPIMAIPVARMIRVVRENDNKPSSSTVSPPTAVAAEGDLLSLSESSETTPTSNAMMGDVARHDNTMDSTNNGEHIPLVEANGSTIV